VKTIAHRELRNDSSRVLDEVSNGKNIQVTKRGDVVAIMIPPDTSRYEVMALAGAIRPHRSDASFGSLRRVAGCRGAR
jgi:antitoxin (DNA-binding transcriptional repressor) of toxin-antitoxin stability system